MAIVQALLAALVRSAGRFLNTALGWATMMLFGKVPEGRQIYLSVIAFGSVIWLAVLAGVVSPDFGVLLLTFVPLPEWVNDAWIRLAMLAGVALIPLVVGFVSLRLPAREDAPRDAMDKAKTVVKGYPYTLALAITLVMMTLFAPILKLRAIVKRWETEHVPVIVKSKRYHQVVDDIQRALRTGGLETERERAGPMMRLPTKVLTLLAGGAISAAASVPGQPSSRRLTLRSPDPSPPPCCSSGPSRQAHCLRR